jgi:hypothetical protein
MCTQYSLQRSLQGFSINWDIVPYIGKAWITNLLHSILGKLVLRDSQNRLSKLSMFLAVTERAIVAWFGNVLSTNTPDHITRAGGGQAEKSNVAYTYLQS